jgi:hypothetical protein
MRALAVAFGNFSICGMVIALMLSGTLEFLGEKIGQFEEVRTAAQ